MYDKDTPNKKNKKFDKEDNIYLKNYENIIVKNDLTKQY